MRDPTLSAEPARETENAAGDDRSLMERVRCSDRFAFDELTRRHWAPLVAYANRLLASRDAAEDVVQETLLRVWNGRGEWTPTERLRGFLYRITRNLALNERRRDRVRARPRAFQLHAPNGSPDTPLDLIERNEVTLAVTHALNALPPRRREVFILARYHGHTYREIAEIMETSPQTVANQMSAALDELRTRLRPQLDGLSPRGHLRLVRDGAESRPKV